MILFNTVLVLLLCFASGRAQIEDPLLSVEAKTFISSLDPFARRPLEEDIFILIPNRFDAREQWLQCDIISWVRNQGDCHCACFVFAIVSMIADRVCIFTNGANQTELSAYQAMTCCLECYNRKRINTHPKFGQCIHIEDFMQPMYLFEFIGLVSGGDYNTTREKGCQPITSRRIEPTAYECSSDHCLSNTSRFPNPDQAAPDANVIFFPNAETHSYLIKYFYDIESIQQKIYRHGPVVGVLFVDDEFRNYKEGVYKGVTKLNLSDVAAVKILGWGYEDDVPYWLAANTMGTEWGNKGIVKILRDTRVVRFFADVKFNLPKIYTTSKPYTFDWSDDKRTEKVESEWMTDEEDQEGEDENNSEALENYTVLIVVTFVLIFLLG